MTKCSTTDPGELYYQVYYIRFYNPECTSQSMLTFINCVAQGGGVDCRVMNLFVAVYLEK